MYVGAAAAVAEWPAEEEEEGEEEGPETRALRRATSRFAAVAALASFSVVRCRSRRKRLSAPWCFGDASWFFLLTGVSTTNVLQCLQ